MDEELRDEAIAHFQKMTSFIYREGRAIPLSHQVRQRVTEPTYNRRDTNAVKWATKAIYKDTIDEDDPEIILDRYQDYSGLSLDDIFQAFSSSSWGPYGGWNWAEITEVAIGILEALDDEDETELQNLVDRVPHLHHNTGRLINKYPQLE